MQPQTHVCNTVIVAPESDRAERPASQLGSVGISQHLQPNSRAPSATEQESLSYPKRLANVTAKLALKGFSLYPLEGEKLLVTRWNLTNVLPHIGAAEAFLRQIGGQP